MENLMTDSDEILATLQRHFRSGRTKPYEARLAALEKLEQMIRRSTDRICRALFEDLGKPEPESLLSEIAITLEEIAVAKNNLHRWMRPRARPAPLSLRPSRNRVHVEPLGTVLIIGPWNYPFQLLFAPLVGALAAGNCAVLKPSELTPKTSRLVAELIAAHFPANFVRVVEGGVPETTALLTLKFDHIFFTGSTAVGKIVMQAAAKHLVPVTLELGGKSPVIVCEDADLDLAARRIVWGKFYNAGQTCVAPDYLYVHESVAEAFIEKFKTNLRAQFGERPKESADFGRIVNHKNAQRLAGLLGAGEVVIGGEVDVDAKYVAPTLITGVSWTDRVMGEEIFGPLLPVLTYRDLGGVFEAIGSRPKPLAAYIFSRSREKQDLFVSELSFGGACINDVVVHLGNPFLPFGGVGDSGMGRYHGEDSFKTFSHSKSVMVRYGFFDFSARYPPSTAGKLRLLRRLFRV